MCSYVQTAQSIKAFMQDYRDECPHATITPKLHLLEEHAVEWLQRWRVGFGMMGEQGAGSIHAHVNILKRTYSNIPEYVTRQTTDGGTLATHCSSQHITQTYNKTTTTTVKRTQLTYTPYMISIVPAAAIHLHNYYSHFDPLYLRN